MVVASSPTLEMLGLDTLKPDWDIEPRPAAALEGGPTHSGKCPQPPAFSQKEDQLECSKHSFQSQPWPHHKAKTGASESLSQRPVGGGPQGAGLAFPGDMKI